MQRPPDETASQLISIGEAARKHGVNNPRGAVRIPLSSRSCGSAPAASP